MESSKPPFERGGGSTPYITTLIQHSWLADLLIVRLLDMFAVFFFFFEKVCLGLVLLLTRKAVYYIGLVFFFFFETVKD